MTANVDTTPDWNKLTRLFKPGNGVMPPKLAGREKPLKSLQGLLDCLINCEPVSKDAVLYGPRGSGKTVLLEHFERGAGQTQVDVLSLRPTRLKNEAELAYQLLYQDTLKWGKALLGEAARLLPAGANLTSPDGTRVGLTWQRMSQAAKNEHARAHLPQLLSARCKDKPLLVTLDEAHTLDLEVGQTLLNASEEVRKADRSFLLALSGTPGLRDHLGKMNATFWGRSEKLAIGRLSEPAAKESLEVPLGKLSVTFDANALAAVIDDAQGYPYFLQVWGEALCEVLVNETQSRRITLIEVELARPAVNAIYKDYYLDRYHELRKQKLLEAAETVAGVFDAQSTQRRRVLKRRLMTALRLNDADADKQLDQLAHLGYIWEPALTPDEVKAGKPSCCEPGIPSLMAHVCEEMQVDRAAVGDPSAQQAIGASQSPADAEEEDNKNDDDGSGGGMGGGPPPR